MKSNILRRIRSAGLAAVMAATLLSGCAGNSGGDYTATDRYVKSLGRTYYEEDCDTLWFSLSGTGVEFTYSGCTECTIDLRGDTVSASIGKKASHPRYAVYVNDELVIDALLSGGSDTVEVPLDAEDGTIRLVKLSEAYNSSMGISGIHVDGTIRAAKEKKLKIEFIGDSITCGYGVDGELGDTFTTATENAMKSYAIRAAELLEADWSLVSYSGYGLVSGYTTNGSAVEEQRIGLYYTLLGHSQGALASGLKADEVEWDFKEFAPDYVVINLGTNDATYCGNDSVKKQEFISAYIDFLKTVREHNKKATIVCTLGIMGQDLYLCIQEAVGKYSSETGDDDVFCLEFDQQTAPYAVDYHPTEETHEKAAEVLAAFITELEEQ